MSSHTHHLQQHEQPSPPSPFMDEEASSPPLFSITNPHFMLSQFSHQLMYDQPHLHQSFCTLNFKLDLNENNMYNNCSSSISFSGTHQSQGLPNLLHLEVPEILPSNSSILSNSGQTHDDFSPPIKQPFWCNAGKCSDDVEKSCKIGLELEEKHRLFGELESSIGGEESVSLRKILKTKIKKKKRREQLGSMVGFFEKLVQQVMEHQESLHSKFLESIERMERGRIDREEAWRHQEAEKRSREAINRASHLALSSTREALLISYIRGQNIELPLQADEISKSEIVDTNSRWPKDEVEALIRARRMLEVEVLKGPVWGKISSAMGSMGYETSAKRCKEKWENINKYFKKKKDISHKSKTCSYFDQLDQLYSTTTDQAD